MYYIATTRFNNDTWRENNEWKERNDWNGCLYGTPVRIADKYTPGQQVAFHSGRMQGDVNGSYQLNTLFYSASTDPFAAIDVNGGSVFGVSFDGTTAAIPVPASAWLFGSALAGLTVVRRRK